MKITKIFFHIINLIFLILYLYPGSILGFLVYNNISKQPQVTPDFYFSSNHVYVFIIFSYLGILSFKKELKKISFYLFSASIFLELLHIIIPNRGFEVADLLGNALGVILSLILYKLITFRRSK